MNDEDADTTEEGVWHDEDEERDFRREQVREEGPCD